jgi:glycerol-3-phosphate acyltransferase PlsY
LSAQEIVVAVLAILIGYLLGSLPSGLIMVRLTTGRDIRNVGSGRTGGTNAMRAGGALAGLVTGILDVVKSLLSLWICRSILPGYFWLEALTGLAVVFGHNNSIFLAEWVETKAGRMPVLRGGAGGAPTLGVAMAFWLPSALIIAPVGVLVFLFVGYASVTTLVGGLLVIAIFLLRVLMGLSSPWYVVFGLGAMILLLIALRPNLERLSKGTERPVGLRAWWKEHRPAKKSKDSPQ